MKFLVGDSKYKMGELEVKCDVIEQLAHNKWRIMKGDLDLTLEYKSETFLSPSQRTIAYVYLY